MVSLDGLFDVVEAHPKVDLGPSWYTPEFITRGERELTGYEKAGFRHIRKEAWTGSYDNIEMPSGERMTEKEMLEELRPRRLEVGNSRQIEILEALDYLGLAISIDNVELSRLKKEGYSASIVSDEAELAGGEFKKVALPGDITVTEYEISRHFSPEEYQTKEPLTEATWKNARIYLELSRD